MSLQVLSNLSLPQVDGYFSRSFAECGVPASERQAYQTQRDRRSLKEILSTIPDDEFPRILVVQSPEYLPIPVDIDTFPGIKVLLITDWNMCLRFLPDVCRLFDFCFTDLCGIRVLRTAGVTNIHHQPLFGFDPERFSPRPTELRFDLSFCGNFNPGVQNRRNRLVYRLRDLHPHHRVFFGNAFGTEYVDILRSSRLVFNHSIRGEANMRLYETMACGAVALVEKSNQEVPLLFRDGEHYLSYEPSRLIQDITGFLQEPERLHAIGERASEAVQQYTRAKQMEAIYRAIQEFPIRSHSVQLGSGATEGSTAAGTWRPGPPQAALMKMRALGAGYKGIDAYEELKECYTENPSLMPETLPGLMLEFVRQSPDAQSPSLILEHARRSRTHPGLPTYLRLYLDLLECIYLKRFSEALEASDAALQALDSETDLFATYGFFIPPLPLGLAFNADLNAVLQKDLLDGGSQALRELLRANILQYRARSLLELGDGEGCLALGESLLGYDFTSTYPEAIVANGARRAGNLDRLRPSMQAWIAKDPFQFGAWEFALDACNEFGLSEERALLEQGLERLSRTFTFSDWARSCVQQLLEKAKANPPGA